MNDRFRLLPPCLAETEELLLCLMDFVEAFLAQVKHRMSSYQPGYPRARGVEA